MHVSRRNGLLVAEHGQDFQQVDRALAAYDDRLVLSQERDRQHDCWRYAVLILDGDRPAVELFRWTDDYGRPLPLSSGLLERVKQLAPRGGVSAAEVQAANDRMVERAQAEVRAELDEIAADMGPRISDKRSAVLPRSQGLRRSRDKQRSRGEIG